MVDAGPEPTYVEKMRVPPSPWRMSVRLSISSNLSLLNAYKWAFVLVGFCPSGLLSYTRFGDIGSPAKKPKIIKEKPPFGLIF